MNDYELFHLMCKAEKEYDKLLKEFRRRGLDKKPYCEWSKFERYEDIPDIPGLKEFMESRGKK